MAENENGAATEKAADETNETQKTEEVTEAVATQMPTTDKGIEDDAAAPTDSDAGNETAEAKTETENAAKADSTDAGVSDEAKTIEAAAVDTAPEEEKIPDDEQEISYHAVEKEGAVTAIWEMQGRKHLRTIDPRSNEGKKILSLFETAV